MGGDTDPDRRTDRPDGGAVFVEQKLRQGRQRCHHADIRLVLLSALQRVLRGSTDDVFHVPYRLALFNDAGGYAGLPR